MIEHLKSGLSVSTHVGCSMGCSYCVLSKLDNFKAGSRRSMFPKEIIGQLKSRDCLFLNGETPLIINNRTDPLLPAVAQDTMELLDLIRKEEIKSPVLLISKFVPPRAMKEYFEKMNLIFIYSYSNIDTDFNYKNVDYSLGQIRKIVPQGHRFHYFRPIIDGYNDDIDEISALIKKFCDFGFDGSILTGLRVTSENCHMISDDISFDPQHKLIKESLFSAVTEQLKKQDVKYQVFRHTSCVVALFTHRKNKLFYFNRENHCSIQCVNYAICGKQENEELSHIVSELKKKFGYNFVCTIRDAIMNIESEVSQEQVAYIKNAYGIRVNAINVVLSPSEREILKV